VLVTSGVWSLASQVAPSLAAIVAIPYLVRELGPDRFGILALSWTLIGYAGVLDFGFGRALTRTVASLLGHHDDEAIAGVAWLGLIFIAVVAILGGFFALALAGLLLGPVIAVPLELRAETARAGIALAAAVPAVVIASALRGLLEAKQAFALTSAVRVPVGVLTFAAPALIVGVTRDISVLLAALAITRWGGAMALFVMALLRYPSMRDQGPRLDQLRPLVSFGFWVSVSSVVSPVMASLDRFFVGALISLAAVSRYAAPFDLITRVLVLPGALAAVAFPAFSTVHVQGRAQVTRLFTAAFWLSAVLVYPLAIGSIALAPELLGLLFGPDFAASSSDVVRWLGVGVIANGLAQVPYALLQGMGRSDLTAKFHLLELAPYVALVIAFATTWGITGVAAAWTLRTVADAALLFGFSAREAGTPWRTRRLATAAALAMVGAAVLPIGVAVRVSAAAIGSGIVVWAAWHSGLADVLRRVGTDRAPHAGSAEGSDALIRP
jgi:O-antigen/teichoic acid export membrane protein